MMKKTIFIAILSLVFIGTTTYAAPYFRQEAGLVPITDSTYYLGTTTPVAKAWKGIVTDELCLTADNCYTSLASLSSLVGQAWELYGSGTYLSPTTTKGIIVSASSTISALTVTNGTTTSATSTNLYTSGQTILAGTSGNVGIGTTNPTGKLNVYGAGSIGSPATPTLANSRLYLSSSDSVNYLAFDDNQIIGSAETAIQTVAGAIRLEAQSNANQLYLATNGNVGIGTSSPTAKLNVAVTPTNAVQTGLLLSNASTAANVGLSIDFINHLNQTATTSRIIAQRTTAANSNSTLQFWNFASGALTEAMRINESNNVGIGTTSPMARLQVERNGGQGDVIVLGDSIYRMGALGIESGTNTFYIGNPYASSQLQFRTSGTTTAATKVTITSSGNVGVGSTTPYDSNGLATSRTVLAVENAANGAEVRVSNGSSGATLNLKSVSTGGFVGTQGAHDLGFQTQNTTRGIITSAGNFGIGTTTPISLLTIKSGLTTTSIGQGAVLTLAGNTSGSGANYRKEIAFKSWDGNTNPTGVIGFQTISTAGSENGDLYFATRNGTTDTAPTEVVRMTAGGRVGIASSTPIATLSVIGNLHLAGSSQDLSWRTGEAFQVGEYDGTTFTERLRILNNGNMGVGSTTPYVKLGVAGTIVSDRIFATSTTASSTMAGGLQITGGGLRISTVQSCSGSNALNTDSSGNVVCGATSGGSANFVSTTSAQQLSSATISDIPAGTTLHVTFHASSTVASTGGDRVCVQFNGDTGANYAYSAAQTDGTGVSQNTGQNYACVDSSGSVTGDGMVMMDIVDIAGTYKYGQFNYINGAAGGIGNRTNGKIQWNGTAKITSITFTTGSSAMFATSTYISVLAN